MAPLLERMRLERPRVCPASVRHGSWRATILPCLLAGRDDAAMSDPRGVLAEGDLLRPPTHPAEGLDAARQIRQQQPQIGILVLSAHVEVDHAMELLASGR